MTDVGGISVPLTLDKSGWSAGLKQAKTEYDQFRSHISRTGGMAGAAGVGRVAPGVVGPAPGVHAPAGPPMATVGNVSPRFAVSAGSVRDMRIEINKQLRTFASQGEAINIPIKLGRVNYGALRSEISTGIGEVPVRITLEPASIAHIRGQIVGAIGTTGGGGRVAPGQTTLPTVRRRASGGPVLSSYPRRAAAGPVKGPGGADLARYPEALMERNLIRLLNSLTERDIKAGRLWYPSARSQLLEGAKLEGFLDLGPKKQQQGRIIAATASVSPQMKWFANLAHSRAVARAAVQGTQPTKAMADANLPWVRQLLGPRSKVSAGVMGLGAREREHAMRLIHGESPESVLQRIKGGKPTGELLPKVYPFSRNLGGDLSMLTLDSIAAQTATSGLPSWVKGAGYAQAPPAGVFRDAMARVHEKVYREHAQGLFPGGIAEMQAALWTRYRGEEFARGGRVPRQRGGRGRRGGYCSVCRSNVTDPVLHRSTAKHLKNVRGPSRGSGRYLRERPSWMNALRDPGGDEELYEERATSYSPLWRPGMRRGGDVRGRGGKFGAVKPALAQSYAEQQDQLWGSPYPDVGYAYHQTDDLRSIRRGGYRGTGVAPLGSTAFWSRGGTPLSRAHLAQPGMSLLRTPMNEQFAGEGVMTTDKRVPLGRLQYWGEDRDWHRFRRGRARIGGGRVAPLAPGEEMPPALGEAPLRPGYVRGYHSTKGTFDVGSQSVIATPKQNLNQIRAEGLKMRRARGHTYGEPNANWFSNDPKGYDDQYAVEAHLPERWFNSYQRRAGDPPFTMGGPNSNMAVPRDISRRRFATYNEPWMRHTRYLEDDERRPGAIMRDIGSVMSSMRGKPEYEDMNKGYDQFVANAWRRRKHRMAGGPAFKKVEPELFHETISSASNVVRGSGRRVGETVSTYPLEEYARMRTYLNDARTAGYAIKSDGDLVSVFNVGEKGAGKSAIRSAIQRGATKLDAFDEVGTGFAIGPVHPNDLQKNLPKFYQRFGFREVGRDPWDPQYAPEGWTGGTPDVVYMARKAKQQRMQRGGFIRDLLNRAGPSREQLREGYGRRLTGMGKAFGNAPLGSPGQSAQALLGRTLSAEQRTPDVDLAQSMRVLPAAMREPGMSKSFEQHAQLQQALSMGLMSEQYGGLQGRREPFQSPLMEPTASGMWRTINPRELPRLDPGKFSRNQRGGKTRVKGRVARDIVGGPINYWDDPGLRKADLYRPDAERKFSHNPWLPWMPNTRAARRIDDIEGGQGGVFKPRVASDEDLALARRLGEHFTYTNINRKRLMQLGGEVLKLSTAVRQRENVTAPKPPGIREGAKGKPEGVEFNVKQTRWGIQVEATLPDGRPIGTAEFERNVMGGGIAPEGVYYPAHVSVDPAYRSKGVGSWMYAEAEKHLGEYVFPSDIQSTHAKRMWSDPRRPFGPPPRKALGGPTEHLDRLFGDIKGMWWNKKTGQYHYAEEAETAEEYIKRNQREANEAFWGGGSRSERARAGRREQAGGARAGGMCPCGHDRAKHAMLGSFSACDACSCPAFGSPRGAGAAPQEDTLEDKLKRMAEQTEQSPHEAATARAQLRKRGVPGYMLGGWLARMAGTPRGEGANLSLRVADPEGLHLRPASALARVGQMAELSGNPIKVTNETAGKTIGYPATGSVIGWTALLGGPRQGHKLNISVGGTETARVVDLLEKLIRFEGPAKTGQSYYDFHDSLGISSPLMTRMRVGKMQRGGAPDDAGMYIVNEIGREKFVPDHMVGAIPPDVFAQLPKRQEGGITEIEGHGPTLWQAPEDGWIIPARLANKVPGRHAGGPIGHRHPDAPGQESFDFPQTPVSMGRLGVTPPEQETWGGIINRVRPPREGPRETWAGAMTPGTGLRDLTAGLGNAFRGAVQGAVQTVMGGRRGGGFPTQGPGGPAGFTLQGTPYFSASANPVPPAGGQRSVLGPMLAGQPRQGWSGGPTGGGQTPNLVPAHLVEPVSAARGSMQTIRAQLRQDIQESRGFTPSRMVAEGLSAEQLARQSATETRGLTGRAAVGSFFGSIFGGGRARKQAMQEGQQLMREAQALGPEGMPRGVSAVEAWGDVIGDLTSKVTSATREKEKLIAATDDETKGTEAYRTELGRLNKDIKDGEKLIQQHTETQTEAAEKEHQANRKFQQASGGALRNIASLTVAGFAFSALQEGITTAFTLASTAAKPFIDQMQGFGSTATRVTQGLAPQLREMGGNLPGLLGRVGGAAGVGGGGLQFLQERLGPSIQAKAGAMAETERSDLFRAALGAGNVPTGLLGGYGGVGGGAFLAEFLGGGKGFAEQVAGNIGAFRGRQRQTETIPGQTETGKLLNVRPIEGILSGGTGFTPTAGLPTPESIAAFEGLTAYVEDTNDAYERGTRARNENTEGLQLATKETLNLVEGTKDYADAVAAQKSLGITEFSDFADDGVFLINKATKSVITDVDKALKYVGNTAQGITILSEKAFIDQRQRALGAQLQAGAVQRQRAIQVDIPGQLGMQLAAQPFGRATAGVPGLAQGAVSPAMRRSLAETQTMQDEIAAAGRAGLDTLTTDIRQRLGGTVAAEFTGYVDDITALGQQITDITDTLADSQANLSFKSYSNNIRILNRSIADAKGLLGRAGGSDLGQWQRQQFELSRQSQRLSLQSQKLSLDANDLALQLSQRQINFQKAIAGFQAPGITGQERAARMAEAELEASFAQKQLDIGVQQQGIGRQQLGISGEQFGLELKVFMEEASRSLIDLQAQRELLVAQHELELQQIDAQKAIAARTVRMGQLQAAAQAIINEAQGHFSAALSAATEYVAQFGGTVAGASKLIMQALRGGSYADAYRRAAGTYGGANTYENQTPHAAGYSATVSGPTSFIAGEAGPEHVLVIRNPTAGVMGPVGGGGGGSVIQINISGNTFGGDTDPSELARRLTDEIEHRLDTKARLLSVSA